jgi:hypothetical protein
MTWPPEESRVRRLRFKASEDEHLTEVVLRLGTRSWSAIAAEMPGRSARQCRERWMHYLSNGQQDLPWSEAEDSLLLAKIETIGLRWTELARHLVGRTDFEVKRRWTHIFLNRRGELRDSAAHARPLRRESAGQLAPPEPALIPSESGGPTFEWITITTKVGEFMEFDY